MSQYLSIKRPYGYINIINRYYIWNLDSTRLRIIPLGRHTILLFCWPPWICFYSSCSNHSSYRESERDRKWESVMHLAHYCVDRLARLRECRIIFLLYHQIISIDTEQQQQQPQQEKMSSVCRFHFIINNSICMWRMLCDSERLSLSSILLHTQRLLECIMHVY